MGKTKKELEKNLGIYVNRLNELHAENRKMRLENERLNEALTFIKADLLMQKRTVQVLTTLLSKVKIKSKGAK